jgi:hypothetical protein
VDDPLGGIETGRLQPTRLGAVTPVKARVDAEYPDSSISEPGQRQPISQS